MGRSNTSNPHDVDPEAIHAEVPLPIQKARVLDANGMPEEDGFHTVRIKVYGDEAPYVAPVLTPMHGSVWVPEEGTDVAVLFGDSDKPWVIGSWYAVDRIDKGDIDLPEYTPGDIILGNENGYIAVRADGTVETTDSFSTYGDEDAQDAVGNILGTLLTYDDSAPSITVDEGEISHYAIDQTTVSSGDHHARYTDEEAQDAIGGILGSLLTYDDAAPSISVDEGEISHDAIDQTTVSSDDHHARYSDEEVEDVVNALIAGGTNITTTHDDANDTLTIDTSALDQEEVEDTIATLLQGSTGVGITYDDAKDTLTIDIDTHISNADAHHSRYTDSEVLSTVGDHSNDVNVGVEDTRHTNEAPTFFDREISYDFKRTSTIGVPASGTYCGVMTFAPWTDNSGDQSHQVAYTNDGLFVRSAFPDSSSWNAWTKIGDENKVFLAEGSNTNINQTTTVSWSSTTFNDNAYSWDGSSQLTIEKAGRYEIHAEADFQSSGDSRQNPNLFIHQNGGIVGVGGRSGYMRDAEGSNHSSVHSHAVISANSGDVIDVESRAEADTTGSITPDRAMFYVKRIENNDTDTPTLGYFDSHLTTTQVDAENGIYVNFAESVNENDGWTVDSASQISPEESGKYKIEGSVNFHRTGSGGRNVMFAELELNGTRLTDRTRGVCYIRTDGNGDEGDATFSTVITLNAGDNVRVFANEERGGKTGNDVERASVNITKVQ